MRWGIVAATMLPVLASCSLVESSSDKAVKACEVFIKDGLRSPATYKLIKATTDDPRTDKSIRSVFVEYDASNAFGTPIRAIEQCLFEADENGGLPDSASMNLSAAMARTTAAAKGLREQSQGRKVVLSDPLDDLFTCCLPEEKRELAIKQYQDELACQTSGKAVCKFPYSPL
jgi:hypothetical protein